MKEIVVDKELIAYCGLYCGACPRYLSEKCPGCKENHKAAWCKLRSCCIENKFSTCADCKEYSDVNQCKKFNNFFSKLFGLIFRSNRKACINRISEIGLDKYAEEMAGNQLSSIKR
jgi:hypothetical protein